MFATPNTKTHRLGAVYPTRYRSAAHGYTSHVRASIWPARTQNVGSGGEAGNRALIDVVAAGNAALRLAGGAAPPVTLGASSAAGQQVADIGGGGSSHEVTVQFISAPRGIRSGITRADSDARVALRTSYALQRLSKRPAARGDGAGREERLMAGRR
jgi:hypothetical protein